MQSYQNEQYTRWGRLMAKIQCHWMYNNNGVVITADPATRKHFAMSILMGLQVRA